MPCQPFRASLFAPAFSRQPFRASLFAPAFSRQPFRASLFAPAFSRQPFRASLFAPAFSRLIVSLALLVCARFCTADPIPWDAGKQGNFITSLCADHQNRTYIGTEDQGVWQFDPSAPAGTQYTHFTQKDGLGSDDVYALLCDSKGRLWAGTLHGLSVYNGKTWKTYGPLEGIGGFRVFALASCPTTGDVWVATEGGLTCYLPSQDRWQQYSRLDGLPSDAVQALAFNQRGDLFVGTQADGIAIATAGSGYKTWRVVRGPALMPNTPGGAGLPTGLINCLLVASDGTVYAGTTTGLARSSDNGLTWRFLRGADWEAKVNGLYHGPKPVKTDTHGLSLLEDYVTCLADDGTGHLLMGHRQQGMEAVSLRDGTRLFPGPKDSQPTDYVSALLPQSDGTALIGGYGGGLLQKPLPGAVKTTPTPQTASAPQTIPLLPTPAKPPTLAELNAMLRVVSAVSPDKDELIPKVVALDDDWVTEGDWLGRYGRYWACLCAMVDIVQDSKVHGDSYVWGAGWEDVGYNLRLGPNCNLGDTLRYWMQWRYSANPRVLELPPTYLHSRVLRGYTTWNVNRRQDEVDDHGETYPQAMDGPHVYTTLTVPKGLFYLSLYDFNKDDHDWTGNRFRDYRLSVRAHSSFSLKDVSSFDAQPELAHGRIRDFWGGVWKRFLVRGPQELTIEVNRNNSFNTILPAVMLDLVDEKPAPYFSTVEQWKMGQFQEEQQRQKLMARKFSSTSNGASASSDTVAANLLFEALEQTRLTNSRWWAANGRRFYAPLRRWYAQYTVGPSLGRQKRLLERLGTCDYQLAMYSDWEQCQKQEGLKPARAVEQDLRWDEVSASNSGRGYEVVTEHQAISSGADRLTQQLPVAPGL